MAAAGDDLTLANISDAPAEIPCEPCRAIVPDRRPAPGALLDGPVETKYARLDLYPAFPALEASAEAGCRLCRLVRRGLRSLPAEVLDGADNDDDGDVPPVVWSPWSRKVVRLAAAWDRKVELSARFAIITHAPALPGGGATVTGPPPQFGSTVTGLWISYKPVDGPVVDEEGNPWRPDDLELPVFDSSDLHSPDPEHRRRLPEPVTLSDKNVRMMKHWINDCRESHEKCMPSATPWLPKRLIQITPGEERPSLRLIETTDDDLKKKIAFAAFSHVWGDIKTFPLRLARVKHEDLLEEIKWSDLPRNFVDAIHVCVSLDIRYIWIDCPCIKQGSREDWREQSGLMHLVYKHAAVTIVATAATSCHDGFLARSIDSTPAVKVAYSTPRPGTEEREPRDGYMILSQHGNPLGRHWLFAIGGTKWNTRAWTMQERSLSTRMLHFADNKLFFECRGCLRSEENEPAQEEDYSNSVLWPRGGGGGGGGDSSSAAAAADLFRTLFEHWQLFVAQYTARDLFEPTDKLPAIRSVARELSAAATTTTETHDYDYIPYAGMFGRNLRAELTWCCLDRDAARPPAWCGPTWSWASVEGQASLYNRSCRDPPARAALPPEDSLLARLGRSPPLSVEGRDEADWPEPGSAARGFLRVRTLVQRVELVVRMRGGGRDGSAAREDFLPFDLLLATPRGEEDAAPSDEEEEEGSSGSSAFAWAKLDVHDRRVLDQEAGSWLYMHVNDDKRITGLLLQPHVEGGTAEDKAGKLWERIGLATLFRDRSEIPVIQDESALNLKAESITIV
ncbi:HET-domain-containing protein [Xylariaceae sp. FL0804]|nr:HET-domain-containing protein [Xylariaceae sp. FL0804]